MKEPYEKGVAIHSASSFALWHREVPAKRKQRHRWAGTLSSENPQSGRRRSPNSGRQYGRETIARDSRPALRSRRPLARLETSDTRTGRPRGCLLGTMTAGGREKAKAVRPARTSPRSRTAA